MSNEIEIFNNPSFGNIRVQKDEDGEPLFCLADVCRALDLTNASMVAQQVCEEFGCPKLNLAHLTDSLGRIQEANFITEQQLYFVMNRSDKPNAKPFRMWVNTVVLPSIRKHGMYATPATLENMIADPDFAISLFKSLKEERIARQQAEEAKAIAEQERDDVKEAFSRSVVSDKDKLYSTFIKELKLTIPCASSILKELKIFGKTGHLSDYGDWFKIKASDNGFPARFVTPMGQMMLINVFNNNRDKMKAINGTYRYIKPQDRFKEIPLIEYM